MAGEHVDRRGLAGAVRPDQSDQLAMLHGKIRSCTATMPPKRLVRSSVSISAVSFGRRGGRRRLLRAELRDHA